MAEVTSFAQMTESLGKTEESTNTQQAQTTETQSTQQEATTTDTSAAATAFKNTGGETQTTETATTEQAATTEEPKNNESAFEISVGKEAAATTEKTATETNHVFNLDEEIKKVDRKELAKKLGFTDFAVEIDEYLNKGGNAIDYLNAKSIDYNKITDEAIIKSDLQKQYPTFTPQQIELMFNRKYTTSEDAEPDEKEFAGLQLKADAHNSRQQKIAEQQKFKIPDTPILQKDEAYEQWKQVQESQPKLMEQFREFITAHDATKSLNESKRVAINLGEGVEPFNFNIDKPELLTQTLTDGGKIWNSLTHTETGEPDVAKQHLITLFSFNPQKFMQDIFKYGLQMGERKQVSEGQNAQRPQAKVADMTNTGAQTVTVKKFGDVAR